MEFSGIGKNVIIFDDHKSSSRHFDNKNKEISIFGKGPTQLLGNTTFTPEGEYSFSFTKQGNRFCLSQNYNRKILIYLLI